MIAFLLLETRNISSVFHLAEFSWEITIFALTSFVIENNRGTEQIAINYSLLQEDVRGHRVFESGWLLQIAEATCFPGDRKPKSSQLPDIVVIKQGWHHIYKSRRQYSHALTKHFHNGIPDEMQTAYITRSGFMSCLHFVHQVNAYLASACFRLTYSSNGLIFRLFNDVVSTAVSEMERFLWILR
jgi:hypothetical protein